MKIILLLILFITNVLSETYKYDAYVLTENDGSYYLPILVRGCKVFQINWLNGRYTIVTQVSSKINTFDTHILYDTEVIDVKKKVSYDVIFALNNKDKCNNNH